ncbi:unnamed protein product [Rotaria socialis]|uniref:Uncharacterized protein n=1 Tax=Rotaria socialis TaxID=392032 RepID=A0A818XK80_9BILA|nr:unnamed protein product [Rotaria socialis]
MEIRLIVGHRNHRNTGHELVEKRPHPSLLKPIQLPNREKLTFTLSIFNDSHRHAKHGSDMTILVQACKHYHVFSHLTYILMSALVNHYVERNIKNHLEHKTYLLHQKAYSHRQPATHYS